MSAHTPGPDCPMSRNVTLRVMPCGCTVDGCGHLPDPVRPVFCALHAAAPALADALELCVKWMPLADVRSWPPGFRLRKEALDAARTALRLARGLP